jgi:hypothetical protein
MGRQLSFFWQLKFPNLTNENHSVTSPKNENYNCLAWACGVMNKRMWPGTPGYYWPSNEKDDLQTVTKLFLNMGYQICEDASLEHGFEKVAIYTDQTEPLHAARQLENGRWTSKLGILDEDIEHDNLAVLEGNNYGKANVFLKRSRN